MDLKQYCKILTPLKGEKHKLGMKREKIEGYAKQVARDLYKMISEMQQHSSAVASENVQRFLAAVDAAYASGTSEAFLEWRYWRSDSCDERRDLVADGLLTQAQMDAIGEGHNRVNSYTLTPFDREITEIKNRIENLLCKANNEAIYIPWLYGAVENAIFPALSQEDQEFLKDLPYLRSENFIHELPGEIRKREKRK